MSKAEHVHSEAAERKSATVGALRKSVNIWQRIEEYALIAMLVVIAALVFVEVVVRDLKIPVSMRNVEELNLILLVWLTFVGAAVAQRMDRHLRVDVLVKIVPPFLGAGITVLTKLGGLLFLALTLMGNFPVVQQAAAGKTTVLEWPAMIWPLSVTVGMVLTAIYLISGEIWRFVAWNERRKR